ncbi:MAG: DUF2271 domain-containing protein [Gemmatimonadota bacterium]
MRHGLLASLLLFTPPSTALVPAHEPAAFSFRHDGILGTSLDLTFVADSRAEAEEAEAVALTEIERVRRLISTWDPSSEVSRLQREGRLDSASSELRRVLELYATWTARTGGAYSARVGGLVRMWKEAERTGIEPDGATLARAVEALREPAWAIDDRSGAVRLMSRAPFDLNSLGKGFILDLAVKAVQQTTTGVRGGLINIGGDIRSWGVATSGAPWRIAIANPLRSADNAPGIATLGLGTAAVSTSGGYARGFEVGGKHYSHIIDARTGRPAGEVIGATVIARDNATANALATSLSMLGVADGLALVATQPGAECLLVTASGDVIRSPGFSRFEVGVVAAPRTASEVAATIAIDITPAVWSRHRPYMAAWVTDTTGRHIRTLAVWGDRPKYLRELSKWWSLDVISPSLVDAVARATRAAGKYTLEWDGTDQADAPVPPGAYQFWLEVAFENGAHSLRSVVVTCGSTPGSGVMPAADAFAGAQVDCVAKKS